MTVGNETVKTTVAGNGVQTVFNYSFPIAQAGAYALYFTDANDVTVLVDQGDYSVSGIGSPSGGTFTYSPAIASGTNLTFIREIPYTQATNLRNQGKYLPASVEGGLDWIVYQTEQLNEIVSRALVVPAVESGDFTLPSAIERANKFLAFDADGLPTVAAGVTGVPVSAFMITVLDDTTAAAARTTLGAAGLADANIFTAAQTIQLSDDGSGAGPDFYLNRISASPAASDAIGRIFFRGRDSAGNVTDYGTIRGTISDPTNASEDGAIRFNVLVAGTDREVLKITSTGMTLQDFDTGAAANPIFAVYRDSASPAANDIIGRYNFDGRDSAAGQTTYGTLQGVIIDPVDGSEDGQIVVRTIIAGAMADRFLFGAGLFSSGVTGGDKGVGTINAGTLYQNDVQAATLGANTFIASQTIQSTDAGGGLAPNLTIDRFSASPAAADLLGEITFRGRDSGANATSYGHIYTQIIDPTDGSEDGVMIFETPIAGTLAGRLTIAAGVHTSSQTDPGTGNMAAAAYFSGGNQVLGARNTGWAAMTGTPNEGTVYDTASITLPQLAGRVMAIQAAMTTHGMIGT